MSELKQTTTGFTLEQKIKFSKGRKAHNSRRQIEARMRRVEVVRLFRQADLSQRGWQADMARELNVNRSTVCRDLRIIERESREEKIRKREEISNRQEFFQNLVHESHRRARELSETESTR